MRAPHTVLVALGAAATVAALAWWLGSRPGGERPLGLPDDPGGVGGVSAEDGAPEPPPEVGRGEAVQLVVEVTPRGGLVPPPPGAESPPCRLVAGDAEIPARVWLVAGARAAVPGADVGGLHLVGFDDGVAPFCRVVALDPTGPVDVQATLRVPLRGVVRGPDGAPVAGAEVWAGGLERDGTARVATTDGDGGFAFEGVRGGAGIPLTVRADGCASRYRRLDLFAAPVDPVEVVLDRAARLDVVFNAPVRDRTRGEVQLAPRNAELGLLHYPFFLAAVRGGRPLGSDGTAAITDLPDGAALDVWVVHPDVAVVPPAVARVRLGRPQRVVVDASAGPHVGGHVRTTDGEPIAGALVTAPVSAATVAHPGVLLPPAAHLPPGGRAITAADGRFRVACPVGGGPCRVEARAPGRLGLVRSMVPGGADVELVLPAAVPFEPPAVLRVHLRHEGREVLARLGRSGSVRVADAVPFEVPLPQPALVDVTVRVIGPAGGPVERRFDAVAVTGAVDLRVDA